MTLPGLVLSCVLAMVQYGPSLAFTEPGLQELMALDSVIQDLRSVMETTPSPARLATWTEPQAVFNDTEETVVVDGATTERINDRLYLRPDLSSESTGQAAPNIRTFRTRRSNTRMKRTSPTPPPSQCPHLKIPSYLNKMEQLTYLAAVRPSSCHHHHHRPNPCPYKPEDLMARLTLLEERVREVDLLEMRLKVHVSLLNGIRTNSRYPGEAGEPGLQGRKGNQGYKGLPGLPGSSGTCSITGKAEPPAGPPGPPGNKGNPGSPGSRVCDCRGEKGGAGNPGVNRKGSRGPRGFKGDKGHRGRDVQILRGLHEIHVRQEGG